LTSHIQGNRSGDPGANLKEFSRRGDNVFTGFIDVAQNHGVRLSKTLHTLNELGKVSRVLGLDGTTHDGETENFMDLMGHHRWQWYQT
jgi:hypothetical protein